MIHRVVERNHSGRKEIRVARAFITDGHDVRHHVGKGRNLAFANGNPCLPAQLVEKLDQPEVGVMPI